MKNNLSSALRRAASTLTKDVGDISSVFPSLSGKKPDPLPPRFSDLKKSLIKGNEDAVVASWQRLTMSLRREIEELKAERSNVIPSIEFADVAAGTVPQSKLDALRHRGTAVIRNVLPREQALDLKRQARDYIAANQSRIRAFPADSPAVYELYWTPSQVQARSHPNMLKAQSFLASFWHSSDLSSEISTTYPLSYADRFRIRQPGDAKFALGCHTDGGSLERWEDPEYSSVYRSILKGHWEQYDPFDARHRIAATMDLYNAPGACSMFRLFQGWLAMSSTGPGEGTLKVCPLIRHATSYLMLRPFINLQTGKLNLDATFPNSVPAAGQEYDPVSHPGLELEATTVSMPQVGPGDYVAWHCDMIHSVDKEHRGKGDSSVMYIPACAITKPNVEFLKKQRISALRYSPPPDFPGAGGDGEIGFRGAVDWDHVSVEGKRSMGLGRQKWDVNPAMSEGERKVLEDGNSMLFG